MCIGFLNFCNFKKGDYVSLCKFSTCLLRRYDMTKMDSAGVFSGKRRWRNTSCSNSMFLLRITCIELPWETFRHLHGFYASGSFWRKVRHRVCHIWRRRQRPRDNGEQDDTKKFSLPYSTAFSPVT